MSHLTRQETKQENHHYEDVKRVDMQAVLNDLQTTPVGEPCVEEEEDDKGNSRIVYICGTYHAGDTTLRITYLKEDSLDIEITGRKNAVTSIKNTLDRIFQ